MDINKYKRVREQKVKEERNDISEGCHNLSSTKLSIDHKTSVILDFSRASSSKNLNIKRQRLHQLILCVKFFNEQINLQRQIISSYNNMENNNNGNNSVNIYKRKKRDLNGNNNVNNSSNINDNMYLKSCLVQEYENSKQKCLIDYNAKINEKKARLKENKEKVCNDNDFIIKNLEESKDIYAIECNDMKQNLLEKEKSNEILQVIKDNVREYTNMKQFLYLKYYKEFINKIEKPKKVTHHFKLNTKGIFNVKPYYESSQNSKRSRNEEGLTSSSKSISITKTHRKIKIADYHSKTKGAINKKSYKK